jgi:hypothetical protein
VCALFQAGSKLGPGTVVERLTNLAQNAAEDFLRLTRCHVRTTLFAEPFVGFVSKTADRLGEQKAPKWTYSAGAAPQVLPRMACFRAAFTGYRQVAGIMTLCVEIGDGQCIEVRA